LQHIILWLPQAIAPLQLQPFIDHLTLMQLIPDATKTTILQPYIGVGKGLISSSDLDNFFDEFRKYGHHATLKRGRSVA
jgi:hypothetical protein